jgi:beta-lactamase regulating signal transducer with metallopeptidase domain
VLQWLVQGIVVAVVATLAAQLMPSTAPRLRHAFWWLALTAVLVLPVMPALPAPHAIVTSLDTPARALAFEVAAPPSWLWTVCLALWAGTTLVGCAALLADLRALRTLKDGARPLPWPTVLDADERPTPALLVRDARLLVSDELAGACAVGFFAPRVILSSRLTSSLEPAALDTIVRHELAHLARFDDWLRLLQRLVLAAAGLHPAVRWICRQIDIEREAACDQLVVEQVGDPSRYARALTAVAALTASVRRSAPLVAPGAVVGGAGLHARVVRMLRDGSAPSPWRLRATAATSVATLALAVAGVAALPPPVAIASLEPSLRALSSLPAGRALIARVPELRARVVPTQRRAAETPVVSQATAAPASIPAQPSYPGADAQPIGPDAQSIVTAEALTVPARREFRIDAVAAVGDQPGLTDAVARASRAGAATGSSAARAGTALGRFFSKGGRAVADRF